MSRKPFYMIAVLLALLAIVVSPALAQNKTPRGGIVVINESPQGNWPGPNFNPFSPSPRAGTRNMIYEPLVYYNPPEGSKPTWVLATGAKYSDDLLSVTFTLRKDVKWSDGQPFSADDVVFTVGMLQKFPALDIGGILALIKGASKVDDLNVKFDLQKVYTQADGIIGGGDFRVAPKHIWEKIDDPVKSLNEKPVATGPFTEVTDFSESVYTILRNPNYWGKDANGEQLPYIDGVRYPAYSGNDTVNNAAISGELDWAGNFIPEIQKTYVAKDPEHYHFYFWPEGAGPVLLYLNTTKEPFSDVKFRQAISNAIDLSNMVDAVYGPGYAAPFNATGISKGRYGDWVSEEALKKADEMGLGKYNPDAAKKMLDDAGYKAGADGIRVGKDGKPIEFKIQTVNGWTDWTNGAQYVAQNLQDIGLKVSIETPEFGAWFAALQGATFQASMGWSTYGRTPWDFFRNTMDGALLTKGSDGKVTANGTTWGRWTSPETDKLLLDFTQTADEAKQKEISNQLQLTYVTNVVTIPLWANPQWYEWNTQRFVGWPTQEKYYAQGSPWNNPGSWVTVNTVHCKDETSCGQKK
jgi:peptide/nickel transport system substrate-binding protein